MSQVNHSLSTFNIGFGSPQDKIRTGLQGDKVGNVLGRVGDVLGRNFQSIKSSLSITLKLL